MTRGAARIWTGALVISTVGGLARMAQPPAMEAARRMQTRMGFMASCGAIRVPRRRTSPSVESGSMIKTKRWNDPEEPDDGYRLLVCRYRPRGVRREDERWDAWLPQLGPSRELHAAAY